jgi:hypothetical protein
VATSGCSLRHGARAPGRLFPAQHLPHDHAGHLGLERAEADGRADRAHARAGDLAQHLTAGEAVHDDGQLGAGGFHQPTRLGGRVLLPAEQVEVQRQHGGLRVPGVADELVQVGAGPHHLHGAELLGALSELSRQQFIEDGEAGHEPNLWPELALVNVLSR